MRRPDGVSGRASGFEAGVPRLVKRKLEKGTQRQEQP